MAKAHISKTLGPIHFEDLDPHRFEDLVRQLAYDFRAWKSIESTGRGGADDGFDVRAYEQAEQREELDPFDEEADEVRHPMEGNLWMIQCKREKEVGPKKVSQIIADCVDVKNPPYGYILAAPVHFSKAAHDAFRDSLRSRGVMEFFLWGAGELEDMLYQPKNDRILFAFFGISLVTKRRSRTTEIRATVNAKNKLMRTLGDDPRHKTVLLRDLADEHYPYEVEIHDFEKRPRWQEYDVLKFVPEGMVVVEREEFAYFDCEQRQWDATSAVNLARAVDRGGSDEATVLAVKAHWELFPRANRAKLLTHGLVRFDSIALIDDRGDADYTCPHIFIEFDPEWGGISGRRVFLEQNVHNRKSLDDLSRTSMFPKEFPPPAFGTIHSEHLLCLDAQTRASLEHLDGGISIYREYQPQEIVKARDVVQVDGTTRDGKKVFVKITNIQVRKGAEIVALYDGDPSLKYLVERQLGREVKPRERIEVLEASKIYDWQIDQNRPVV